MGSKTKIVVFKMRELIYTGIFVTLGIILIILFIFMFTPRDKEKAKDDQPTETTAAMKYVAGVYTTPITLNDNAIDVEVVVDQDHINSIRLVNLSDTVTTMLPLVQPPLRYMIRSLPMALHILRTVNILPRYCWMPLTVLWKQRR